MEIMMTSSTSIITIWTVVTVVCIGLYQSMLGEVYSALSSIPAQCVRVMGLVWILGDVPHVPGTAQHTFQGRGLLWEAQLWLKGGSRLLTMSVQYFPPLSLDINFLLSIFQTSSSWAIAIILISIDCPRSGVTIMILLLLIIIVMVTQHITTGHIPTRWESVMMMKGGNMTRSNSHHTHR